MIIDFGVKVIDDYILEVILSEFVSYFYKLFVYLLILSVLKVVIEKFGEKWI